MIYNDDDLIELQQLSYNYSLYRTGNFDLANDISMKTIGIFLLKADTIDKENSSGWIINTSKNHIQSHYRSFKKNQDNIAKYRHDLLAKFNLDPSLETDSQLKEAFTEVLHTLDIEETKMILLYFQLKEKTKIMNTILDISYEALRKKIFRIKRKLKAETYKKLGVIATKKIVTPQLNKLIIDFLKSFKKNLEENTLEKMYYYFSKVDLNKFNPTYEIKKIVEYEIEFNDSIYKVWVFFQNNNNESDSFYIRFVIDEKKHLKILTPPQKSEKMFKFNKDSEEGKKILQMLKSAPVDKTGLSQFSSEELEKLLKQIQQKPNPDK
ncbi:MAG: hypothetical protein P9L97_01275 [Candidatus Tenebribacter davisii]|nr:hypothetical protein [Candidatus Tenebribacter davisii]